MSNPDSTVFHSISTCPACLADLTHQNIESITKRQVFDVEIRSYVVEHQVESKKCDCGNITTASFPKSITAPVQIGNNARSISLLLSAGHFVPLDRVSEIMETVFEIPISDTSILKYETDLAKNLEPFHQESLEYLKKCDVKHSDETGMRVGKKTHWMHVLCDEFVTYLKHQEKRKVQYEDLKGILVHDHYNSYLQLSGVTHAFCNAHILRELKALKEYEKEPWACEMHSLLQLMNRAKNEGRLDEKKEKFFNGVFGKILKRGLDYHESLLLFEPKKKRGRQKRRIGHNLLLRLQEYREGTLLFMNRVDVPFTNNQAERDLRMVKVKQKVSGCFRTISGVENFAINRSYIATSKKNDLNILEAIKTAMSGSVSLSSIFTPYKSGLPALIA